ncbi:adenosylcobinamide-phosphate synthase CbiB [Peribacillus sp. SCS-155]|uniref:adenosylcobinamide-phosphate synthase CbiB n=1 Tax=Peribacillus sedimenti TaxID=3115297 RepID=UPI0039064779
MIFLCHIAAVTLAFLLDLWIGDPKNLPHPVRWMGRMIAFLEKRWNQGVLKKQKGLFMVITVLLLFTSVTGLTVYLAYSIHLAAGVIWEAAIISTAIAQKSLKEAAMDVYFPLKAQNLNDARIKLSYIVGRDTDQLEETEIVRGTVETVAENTSDGITAPLFWAAAGGAVLAVAYRVINTCDSMVGYRNDRFEEFGWASAKLDDIANYIPSRITAFLMLASSKSYIHNRKTCLHITLRDAKKHPSPNSGWGEAAAAALLGVELGGVNYYKGKESDRARMGIPATPLEPNHILQSISIMHRSSVCFILLIWLGGLLIAIA